MSANRLERELSTRYVYLFYTVEQVLRTKIF